jgi:transposase
MGTLPAMAKGYLPYNLDQRLLLPVDMRDWVPEGHLASFILDVVSTLDLTDILRVYEAKDTRGRAGYHPAMMVGLLLYAYCVGKPSSRKIEKATYEDVAFRVIAGNQHPDHDCIADFRKQHLQALSELFYQALLLCQEAGLVKLGHVALDGTKMKANASKHKAMSYERMGETERKLQEQIDQLLAEAEQVDAEEDAKYGKGKRIDELPGDLARRESRLNKLREAKAALEAEAKARAEAEAKAVQDKLDERKRKEQETGKKTAGRPPQVPDPERAQPDPKAQRNFTDAESKIMPDGANKGSFLQGYNAEAAVDSEAQIIVAADVTQQTNDKQQLVPMVQQVVNNLLGQRPEKASADSGFYSKEALEHESLEGIDLYVPAGRQKHGTEELPPSESKTGAISISDQMRAKLQSPEGREVYRMRKAIVEPVFGQIKEARGLRRFLMRGLEAARAEWNIICMTHNLLKLYRSGRWNLAAA